MSEMYSLNKVNMEGVQLLYAASNQPPNDTQLESTSTELSSALQALVDLREFSMGPSALLPEVKGVNLIKVSLT